MERLLDMKLLCLEIYSSRKVDCICWLTISQSSANNSWGGFSEGDGSVERKSAISRYQLKGQSPDYSKVYTNKRCITFTNIKRHHERFLSPGWSWMYPLSSSCFVVSV